MTETLVPSSRRASKTTCRRCNHTVHVVIVQGVDGPVTTETDPELISVVPFEARNPAVVFARRLHAERCEDYAREAERAKLADERRVWDAKQKKAKKVG